MHKCKQTKALYRLEKPKGKSGMDNPEKVSTVGYTRHKTKTSKTKNTTQYVLNTTIQRTQDEDKQNKKHNTICVGQRNMQTNTNKARVLLQTTGGKVETFCC